MITCGIDFGTGNSILAFWTGNDVSVLKSIGVDGIVSSDVFVGTDSCKDTIIPFHNSENFKIEQAIKRRLLTALVENIENEVVYLKCLAAAKIRQLFTSYNQATESKVALVVLTCPANTGQAYREILIDIARQVGLPSVDIVDEPTAAAVHHGLGQKATANERWMVIDWGCGTLDVSMIQRTAGSADLKVVSIVGDNELGGSDMDKLLVDHMANRLGFNSEDVKPYEAERIKKRLSDGMEVEDALELNSGATIQIKVSREELEQLVAPLLIRCDQLVKQALREAHWESIGPDRIIATGGPILMPCVKRYLIELTDEYGAELNDRDPLTSVALGAARLAEIKRIGGLLVTSKVSKSIGIRVAEGDNTDVYHKVIHRGEERPVRRSVELCTSVDLQDIIEIEIREGDNESSAEANSMIARLNAVVRPDNKGSVRMKLNLSLSDNGGMEAYLEPLGDSNSLREVQPVGIKLGTERKGTATAELRAGDPVSEFKEQVLDINADPDTARQIYDRLKVKYHPDRQPENHDHWVQRLEAMDNLFNDYLRDIERQMQSSNVPNLPWDISDELESYYIDEVLAKRMTHCLANEIGTPGQQEVMTRLLKKYPDYRRILASYLFGIKRNKVLQDLLAKDDRPHVGLVVLLQNIPDKPIRERHEVLKAAYRVPEAKVREFLSNPALEIDKLYELVPSNAQAEVNPINGAPAHQKTDLQYEYLNGDTIITGNTYPVKDQIKAAARMRGTAASFDYGRKAWVIKGKHITDKDIFG